MFIMGKANDEEIRQIKDMGFDVEDVDINHFNKALDPNAPDCDPDYNEYGDKMISIFIDCDVLDEIKTIYEEEKEAGIKA